MASLVLTDSSQLTSDSQQIGVSCQSAPKKPWGYCRVVLYLVSSRTSGALSLTMKLACRLV
ncbi:unnamed protein product [Timema podura]|uniref:Uncharacterized protein n=1 Tax=Timema podura TaxID=61482 RepID=A0ABN7NZ20_TIMPD|nr:unnamed protein product [Timema podura]